MASRSQQPVARTIVNNGNVHFDEDELLSAYLDGEVTEAERALVEARLARDPSTRSQLEELRSLSASLRALPRDPAPANLQMAALRGLTRPTVKVAKPSRWFRRREIWAASSAIAATVLVVGLLPWTQQVPSEMPTINAPSRIDLAYERSPAASLPLVAGVESNDFADSMRGTSLASSVADEKRQSPISAGNHLADGVDSTPSLVTARASGGPNAELSKESTTWASKTEAAKEAEQLAQTMMVASNDSAAAGKDLLVRLEPWQEIQPYLGLINQNSGVVTNFDMHVIDTVQAADEFQVLLLQNGMVVADADRRQGSSSPANPFPPKDRAAGLATDQPVLVGVYIEADDTEPVTKTLETMARQNTLVGLKLQPPLQIPEDVVANSVGQPGRRRASEPADEQLAQGLIGAYIDVQNGRTDADVVAQAPVSALSALPGGQALARLGDESGTRTLSAQPNTPLGVANALSVNDPLASAPRAEAPVARYSQIVNVPQPVDWYAELQQEQQKTSGESPADLAFNKQLKFGSNMSRLMEMKRDLQANSAGRYRLFFVLKPTNEAATPAKPTEASSAPE